jgi:hypothetical protein
VNDVDVKIGDKQLSIPTIQFVEMLPSGANSIVYKGFDTMLDRLVVVKFWVKTRENGSSLFQVGNLKSSLPAMR